MIEQRIPQQQKLVSLAARCFQSLEARCHLKNTYSAISRLLQQPEHGTRLWSLVEVSFVFTSLAVVHRVVVGNLVLEVLPVRVADRVEAIRAILRGAVAELRRGTEVIHVLVHGRVRELLSRQLWYTGTSPLPNQRLCAPTIASDNDFLWHAGVRARISEVPARG